MELKSSSMDFMFVCEES